MTRVNKSGNVIITNARLSYPNLFTPQRATEEAEPKYNCSILISKDDEESVKIIKDEINKAIKEGAEKLGKNIPKTLKVPLRDGDEDRPDDEVYANHYFINANSKRKPQVVGKYKDPETGKPIELDEDDVYAGCYCNFSVNFYAFNVSGNKGIAAGLNNVQKVKDGERLAGGSNADDDFEFEEYEEVTDDDDFFA